MYTQTDTQAHTDTHRYTYTQTDAQQRHTQTQTSTYTIDIRYIVTQNTQTHPDTTDTYTNMQIYTDTHTQTHGHKDTETHRHTDTLAHLHTHNTMHRDTHRHTLCHCLQPAPTEVKGVALTELLLVGPQVERDVWTGQGDAWWPVWEGVT